jgi:hypothetical protein
MLAREVDVIKRRGREKETSKRRGKKKKDECRDSGDCSDPKGKNTMVGSSV